MRLNGMCSQNVLRDLNKAFSALGRPLAGSCFFNSSPLLQGRAPRNEKQSLK